MKMIIFGSQNSELSLPASNLDLAVYISDVLYD